jgi:hypothetical protein
LLRLLFGALSEREVSDGAAGVFQALVHLAGTNGTLRVLAGGEVVAEFDTAAPAQTAEDIIGALFQRYSEWDIASR